MNKKETAEAIKVMQAYVDGTPPEQKAPAGNYGGPIEPSWNWDGDVKMYRIKPAKPRKFWISKKNIPDYVSGFGREVYITTCPHETDDWIKVREVE